MTSSPEGYFGPERPHLMQLVLASKRALQHGEQLCSRAGGLSAESAQSAVDLLALDAKVRWITHAVTEQLKLAGSVAKIIERKRSDLEKKSKTWDALKIQRSGALDAVLDSLGGHAVPPDFYLSSPVSSLFGSQHSGDELKPDQVHATGFLPGQSPTETLRDVMRDGIRKGQQGSDDRTKWKTLRDFVDEQSIEDTMDAIEAERNALDDILATTSDYPDTLVATISVIQSSLPPTSIVPPMTDIFTAQETVSAEMANHLSSLLEHYDQMVQALHDSEAGEKFAEEDLQVMNRDTDELPAIITDLEDNFASIEKSHEQLLSNKRSAQEQLELHRNILTDLDELGDILAEMLERQDVAEVQFTEQLGHLEQRLSVLEDLHQRYTSYQYSYCKLVVELARRRKYAELATTFIKDMTSQLQSMIEKEQECREEFITVHGAYLPMDVCLSMTNMPVRWQVIPEGSESGEDIPQIDPDILADALNRIATTEGELSASQSL